MFAPAACGGAKLARPMTCYPTAMGKRTRKGRIIFWSLVGVGVVLGLLFLAILVPNLIITRAANGFILPGIQPQDGRSITDAPSAQAAIVLGAGLMPDGSPSRMLEDRLKTGIELYKLGKVGKVLLSGAPNQVPVMLEYTLEGGVPDKDIFTDYAGFNTYDTMYRAVAVYQVKSALVATQAFHIARAVYTARTLGIDAVGILSDIQPYGIEIDDKARDWLARVKAIIELHITHPRAPGLGPVIPIDGDGRSSREASQQ
jgi:SanA protein